VRAIIVGHTGQDGTLLCNSLKQKGYKVLGFSRSSVYTNSDANFNLRPNLTDEQSIYQLVQGFQPSEIYYLAAYHTSSERQQSETLSQNFALSQSTHVTGLLYFLCAIKDLLPSCKLFYASSSLVFSGEDGEVQTELTPLSPQGFYGITKAQAMYLCQEFRSKFGIFVSVGILYNHESYLRSHHFLSQKIIQAALRIASGSQEKLMLGDLSARVDWSYAPDFIKAFQDIIQLSSGDDFIISRGEAHSVEEFVDIVFDYFNLDYTHHVTQDNSLLQRRLLTRVGDCSKLKRVSGWTTSLDFYDFVRQLVIDSESLYKSKRL
jgi:GDPmannose 4,6-dehydratase